MPFVFLDEPTLGLDYESKSHLIKLLKDENIIREFVKEKTDTVKDNDDDIEPCYLIEAETEDGKLPKRI